LRDLLVIQPLLVLFNMLFIAIIAQPCSDS
jgi:hypothetical protein